MSWNASSAPPCPRCGDRTGLHEAYGNSSPPNGWRRMVCGTCGYLVLTPADRRRHTPPNPGDRLVTGKD